MARKPVGRLPILSQLRVKDQIALVFCLAIALPVALLGFFTMRQTVGILYDRAYEQLEADNTRAKAILFDATLTFYNLSDFIISDENLQQLLQADYADKGEARAACDSYGNLQYLLSQNASVSSVRVYVESDLFPTERFIQSAAGEQVRKWFEKVSVPGSLYWESSISPLSGTNDPELTLVRSFPFMNSQRQAILVIRMSTNYLKNRIQTTQFFTALSVNRDPIFFCSRRSLQGTWETAPIDYSRRYFQESGRTDYLGEDGFYHISTFVPYMGGDATLYITSVDFSSPDYIENFMGFTLAIFLIAIVLPGAVILLFRRWFNRRVAHLKTAMHQASLGEFDPIEPFKGDDEFSVIFEDLQNMIANVRQQQAEIYQSQLKEQALINQQQKMEFKLLASQINPHFIYNTLETIRMMALCEGARDVAGAAALFGKTMRYVLENTGASQATLDKELDYVRNYLAIQKLRFEDMISYSIHWEEGFSPQRYLILPLLLQPIVENSVSHGIKEKGGPGAITIQVRHRDNRLFIQVSDDGAGIPPDKLTALRARVATEGDEPLTSSIGLYNIYHRIQLFYGTEYGMEIESEEGKGTCVTLTLPLLPA